MWLFLEHLSYIYNKHLEGIFRRSYALPNPDGVKALYYCLRIALDIIDLIWTSFKAARPGRLWPELWMFRFGRRLKPCIAVAGRISQNRNHEDKNGLDVFRIREISRIKTLV